MASTALIVFDMDGVLVDVSGSYRETVRRTARIFFTGAGHFDRLPDPLFSLRELAAIKQGGGLNNDWDLTAAVLDLLMTRVACPAAPVEGSTPWESYVRTVQACDVSGLATFLHSPDGTLPAIREQAGRPPHPLIAGTYRGDVGSGNVIKQIFQEVYLGRSIFEKTYGFPPALHDGEGLIDRESLLTDPELLADLAGRHTLAIATGRPRSEAAHPLTRFGVQRHFAAVLTLDDCLAEERRRRKAGEDRVSLSKPHPWMLDAVAADLPGAFAARYYVGDMPDDMVAAKRSRQGFTAVGVLASSPDRVKLEADLLQAGADHVIASLDDLPGIVAHGG